MADRTLRCHKCNSPDLLLREAHLEWGEWGFGGLVVTDDGEIRASGEASWRPGDPQPALTEIECGGCGHFWHPRREFAGNIHHA